MSTTAQMRTKLEAARKDPACAMEHIMELLEMLLTERERRERAEERQLEIEEVRAAMEP